MIYQTSKRKVLIKIVNDKTLTQTMKEIVVTRVTDNVRQLKLHQKKHQLMKT